MNAPVFQPQDEFLDDSEYDSEDDGHGVNKKSVKWGADVVDHNRMSMHKSNGRNSHNNSTTSAGSSSSNEK